MAYKDPKDPRLLEKRREHYRNNKESYLERARKRECEMKKFVIDLKNAGSCKECDASYPDEPWLMEFDHRDQTTKSKAISAIVKSGSWKKLHEEIDKCDLLCVVCHRRRTAKQLGWKLYEFVN